MKSQQNKRVSDPLYYTSHPPLFRQYHPICMQKGSITTCLTKFTGEIEKKTKIQSLIKNIGLLLTGLNNKQTLLCKQQQKSNLGLPVPRLP